MDEILTKPLQLKTLEDKLEQWLPAGACGQASLPAAAEPALTVDEISGIDADVWKRLLEADERRPGFLAELLRLFSSDADSRMQAIGSAIEDGRPDKVLRDVHALRSGCLQIGASGMAELSKQLHQAAEAGQAERVVSLYARLKDESEQVKRFLESESEVPGLGDAGE